MQPHSGNTQRRARKNYDAPCPLSHFSDRQKHCPASSRSLGLSIAQPCHAAVHCPCPEHGCSTLHRTCSGCLPPAASVNSQRRLGTPGRIHTELRKRKPANARALCHQHQPQAARQACAGFNAAPNELGRARKFVRRAQESVSIPERPRDDN